MFLTLDFGSFEPWLWIIIFAFTVGIELLTVDLVCIWFSVGALVAFLLEALNVHIGYQIAAFLVVSCILIFTVGKYARKILISKNKTNVDALLEQEIIILKDTSHMVCGEGKINGIIWSTICINDETIKKGSIAIIKEVQGNKLYIKSKD